MVTLAFQVLFEVDRCSCRGSKEILAFACLMISQWFGHATFNSLAGGLGIQSLRLASDVSLDQRLEPSPLQAEARAHQKEASKNPGYHFKSFVSQEQLKNKWWVEFKRNSTFLLKSLRSWRISILNLSASGERARRASCWLSDDNMPQLSTNQWLTS